MNKTITLCLSVFMLLGLIGAVAQTDESQDIRTINIITNSVPSMVDPDRVITTPLKIGESLSGRYQASCQKAREWIRVNVVDVTSGHHNYIGKYKFNNQATDENGNPICQILRYAEKQSMENCRSDTSTKSSRKKVYDMDNNIIGYQWRIQCVKTHSDWKIVDLNQPEQSYKDFLSSLDTTIIPAPVFKFETGDE